MPLTELEHLKQLAEIIKPKIDDLNETYLALRTQIQTLVARQDSNITAATEDSEVIDARIDAWGNEHGSLGTNIREGQLRLEEAINDGQAGTQEQIQELAETRINGLLEEVDAQERRRQEMSHEADTRLESDSSLQTQIQELSEADLRMAVMVSEIRETLRKLKEE